MKKLFGELLFGSLLTLAGVSMLRDALRSIWNLEEGQEDWDGPIIDVDEGQEDELLDDELDDVVARADGTAPVVDEPAPFSLVANEADSENTADGAA